MEKRCWIHWTVFQNWTSRKTKVIFHQLARGHYKHFQDSDRFAQLLICSWRFMFSSLCWSWYFSTSVVLLFSPAWLSQIARGTVRSLYLLQFNISKCVHVPITHKTKPTSHQYSLFGHPLSKVTCHAYLGVKLDSKLSWAKHITEITTKSSKVVGNLKSKTQLTIC